MRLRIRTEKYTLEFDGVPALWNEFLRPVLGGPEAPAEAAAGASLPAPARAPAPPTLPAQPAPATRPMTQPAWPPAQQPPQPQQGGRPGPAPWTRERQEPLPPPQRPSPYGAPPRPAAPPAPVSTTPTPPRRWIPPRPENGLRPGQVPAPTPNRPPADEQGERDEGTEPEQETLAIEASSDPATLYARLTALGGRRSEKEAVLAAVWFLTRGERDTTAEEVERHLAGFGVFAGIKVVPHLLKHVSRTRMLEQGALSRTVRLTEKGVAHAKRRLVGE